MDAFRHDPWALALPDGEIVLSRQAVDLCYGGFNLEKGASFCVTLGLG